jgi:hypothetical protein
MSRMRVSQYSFFTCDRGGEGERSQSVMHSMHRKDEVRTPLTLPSLQPLLFPPLLTSLSLHEANIALSACPSHTVRSKGMLADRKAVVTAGIWEREGKMGKGVFSAVSSLYVSSFHPLLHPLPQTIYSSMSITIL